MTEADIVPITSRDFWVKVIEMLKQNWALIEPATDEVTVYFLSDDGDVFDELKFWSEAEARSGLMKNGFRLFTSNPAFREFLTLPSSPFRRGHHSSGAIYSSGQFWRT